MMPWVEDEINDICQASNPVYKQKEWAISTLVGTVQQVTFPVAQDENIKCVLITDWIICIRGIAGTVALIIDKAMPANTAVFKFIESAANQIIVMNECFYLARGQNFTFEGTTAEVLSITVGYHRISTKT